MAGFRYQLLHSVAALLAIRDGEELLLEIEEDYSIAAGASATNVQVKNSQASDGPRPYSLQSSEVRGALDRYWVTSAGGDLDRHLIFLARGGASRERDHLFPGDSPGLVYWGAASLEADTGPLRTTLCDIMRGTELGRWLATEPSDGELRGRLLRRVQWQLASRSEVELAQDLEMQVRENFHQRGWPLSAAKSAVKALVDLAFETAAKPAASDRRLTAMDLALALESVAGPAFLAGHGHVPPPSESVPGVLVTEPEFDVPGVALRTSAIETAARGLAASPLIWIHGTNGVGKSTFARLLAKRRQGRWLALDLRPVQKEPSGSVAAWRELVSSIARSGPLDGIIVDDFDDEAARGLRSRLIALCLISASRGARVIVTSHHQPSPALLAECGALPDAMVQAPYFSEEDVEELVRLSDPPEPEMVRAWATMIRMSTGGGHPLLAAAKIASLRARGWPREALVEDLMSNTSEALRISRDDARRSLMKDLRALDQTRSLEAGQLLRRIGCVFDRVDEDLVRALAQAAPALPNAGDALAVLRGTWLEGLPGRDYRLSPLLTDMVGEVPPAEANQWRRVAAERWMKGRRLDARTLPLCFWNAYLGDHPYILMVLCTTLATMPPEKLQGAAALLSPFAAFKTDQSLLRSNPAVAAQLRLLQFETANAIQDEKAAGRIAGRLFEEIDALGADSSELSIAMTVPAAMAVLRADFAGVTIAERIRLTILLRVSLLAVKLETEPGADDLLPPKLRGKVDAADALFFSTIMRRIRGSADAVELMETLGSLPPAERNRFLDAASAIYEGNDVLVHSGWTRVQLDGGDMAAALADYWKIAEIVGLWERLDIEAEVVCAQAIILDEGLGDRDRAIAVLDDAIGRYGNQVGLLRQKSKVLGHAGDHAAAAKLLLEIEDVVGAESPFGRALALRDGAVSAAKAERYEDALRLWGKAAEQQSQMSSRPAWFAAFKIERALVLWRADRTADALAETADALDAIEALDAAGSRQAERTHQYARALINLFLGDRFEDLRPRQSFFPGDASVLESDEEALVGAVLSSLPDVWRLLAALEAQSGIYLGLERRSWAKLAGPVLAGAEIMLIEARYRNALIAGDLASAIRCRFALVGVQRAIQDAGGGIGPKRVPPFDFQESGATPLGPDAMADDAAYSGLLDVVLHRTLASGKSPDDEIRTSLSELSESAFELGGDFPTVVRILFGEAKPEPHHPIAFVSAYAISLPERAILEDPNLRLYRDMLLVRQVATSPAKAILAPLLNRRMIDGWSLVINQQTFLLRDPAGAVPALRTRLARMTGQSLSGSAAFILEAAPAVGFQFQHGWDALLTSIAGE